MEKFDLLEPEKLYKTELKEKHHQTVLDTFDKLTKESGVKVEENQATCEKYYKEQKVLDGLNKKARRLNALKILFIILCLLIVGIFLLIFVYKPRKKLIDDEIAKQTEVVNSLLDLAKSQMASLNALFDSSMPARLMSQTTPLIEMDRIFDIKKYEMMREKYGMWDNSDEDCSTLNLQSGSILGNPFVLFKDKERTIIQQTYEGRLTITYSVGSGDNRRVVTQVLVATIQKPKPVYSNETYLVYCNEAANNLSFSRSPSKINSMDEKSIEKYVRKNESDLSKLAEKQMKKGGTYTPLGNSEFELFFGGLDRDNEVEYRLLFTPLAQKSMLALLKSKEGYGDDFWFKKSKGVNLIHSSHSQGSTLFVNVDELKGFDYRLVKENFVNYMDNYFKALFFDFAPLLCIPLYSDYKSHEYIYKDLYKCNVNPFEHEVLANMIGGHKFAHKDSNTDVILKTSFVSKDKENDVVEVTANSYKAVPRVEMVMKMGGDGRLHAVPVHWTEYIPVSNKSQFRVTDIGINDEVRFNSLNQNNIIYSNGLVANMVDINVDINKLKQQMKKD